MDPFQETTRVGGYPSCVALGDALKYILVKKEKAKIKEYRFSRQTVVMKVTLIFRCKEHNKGQHNMGGVSIER